MCISGPVICAVRTLVPSSVEHRATLDLAAPVDGWLAVLGRRCHRLLHVFVLKEILLPIPMPIDALFERVVGTLDSPVPETNRISCPNFVLVSRDHFVKNA